MRFGYLEALSARIPGQRATVRRLLASKLQSALDDYALRLRAPAPAAAAAPADTTCAPLAELNAHIRRAAPEGASPPHELASVSRFRRAWEGGRTLDQLEQALARRPANAGPLNSHALVLRSLGLMQALSMDYLRRFLGHAETLQWLEQARDQYRRESARTAKPAARSRRRK
ncbi:Conserved hypothetical protein [Ramlibacter tataouinensis TTB310]|uniref:DUF2894 domain-containing protein n=1 Tax=Ramlibacter tataouinensis (strain ATCC BAA-407 / DSM 14655 / LMG 21543 / TTB310) TaxID=365046 RepID=F5Y4G1_RAMTT|nr:Conserved hypothetical protein [Ramlibacter tataouinensis TTB310]